LVGGGAGGFGEGGGREVTIEIVVHDGDVCGLAVKMGGASAVGIEGSEGSGVLYGGRGREGVRVESGEGGGFGCRECSFLYLLKIFLLEAELLICRKEIRLSAATRLD
jgi:hypothetical protein